MMTTRHRRLEALVETGALAGLAEAGPRLGLALTAFVVFRVVFFAVNHDLFEGVNGEEYFKFLFLGLRFDVAGLCYFNLIYVIVALAPVAWLSRGRGRLVPFGAFVFFNGLAQLLNAIDVIYFRFSMKRSTRVLLDLIFLGDDIPALLPRILWDYWWMLLFWIFMVVGLGAGYWLGPARKGGPYSLRERALQTGILVLMLALMVVGIRGGFQLKPLNIIDAGRMAGSDNVALVTNTPFVMVRTLGQQTVSKKRDFDRRTLDGIMDPVRNYGDPARTMRRRNVVVIIMESFGKEYMGEPYGHEGLTPFLDSLAGEGLFFNNAFTNGRLSMEAMAAVAAGVPSLMDDPYISSAYSINRIESLASVLGGRGYTSAFFHGGRAGTLHLDSFTQFAGFQRYYSMDDYPEKVETEGKWGIYDEPFFEFFADRLSGMKPPFLGVFYSLTSHHPFLLPAQYQGKFEQGRHPIFRTVRYSDLALRKFFARARQTDWYNNTLFVITADHPGPAFSPYYRSRSGSYAVPLIFFQPGDDSLTGASDRVTQQIDIMPTVLDYLDYPEDFFSFGSSALADGPGFAVNYKNEEYQCLSGPYSLLFADDEVVRVTDYKKNLVLSREAPGDAERLRDQCRAFIQVYNEAVSDNRMTRDSWPGR